MTAMGTSKGSATDRELVITRVFEAPRELVFKMWTDPEHSKRWAGPRGFTAIHVYGELRPGGTWRLCLRPDDGGPDLWQGGVYREFIAPERFVQTFAWDDMDGNRGHETIVTVTFEENAGQTTMTFRQSPFTSVQQRDGHQGGWSSAFDRLAEYLEQAVTR